MESQPAWRQRCRMHRMPWRDNSKGLRGQAGVKRMRHLSQRSGGTTEVRSIHERQDVCELSSSTHLRGAQESGIGRRVITISRRRILTLLAGASALTVLEMCPRVPRECTTGCPEKQQIVRLENSVKSPDVPQTCLQLLRIGSCRGSSSTSLFCLGKRGTMKSRSSLIGVNITSDPNLHDSCWTSTIRKHTRFHAAPRIGPMKSASVQECHVYSTQLLTSAQCTHPDELAVKSRVRVRQS